MKSFTIFSEESNLKIYQINSKEFLFENSLINKISINIGKKLQKINLKNNEKIPIKIKNERLYLIKVMNLIFTVHTNNEIKENEAFEFLFEIYPIFKINYKNYDDLNIKIFNLFKKYNQNWTLNNTSTNYLTKKKSITKESNFYKTNIINETNEEIEIKFYDNEKNISKNLIENNKYNIFVKNTRLRLIIYWLSLIILVFTFYLNLISN